jgi:hypothetical protein
LYDDYIFIDTNGNFGWQASPMVWDVVGKAILSRFQMFKCPLHLFVDDFMGLVKSKSGAKNCQDQIVTFMKNLFHPDIIAVDKSVLGQQVEILGWLIDLLAEGEPTMRPKNGAIEKLCFILWSFDINRPQSLHLWQALQSLTERYSCGLRGMRCHVAPFSTMVSLCTPRVINKTDVGNPTEEKEHSIKTKLYKNNNKRFVSKVATPVAKFAIELWRICSLLLWKNPDAFAVPISWYLHLRAHKEDFVIPDLIVITDAGPIRVAVAIYAPGNEFGVPLCWSSVSIPWLADNGKKQFQAVREYIGLVLGHALLAKLYPKVLVDRTIDSEGVPHSVSSKLVKFQWISDSTTALAWAANGIARSLASQIANMVTCWFALYSKIELVDQAHVAGSLMGDIDAESRKEKHLLMGNLDYAPSLVNELYIDLERNSDFLTLLKLINPTNMGANVEEFFKMFMDIHSILSKLFPIDKEHHHQF